MFVKFCKNFLSRIYAEWLVIGNIHKEQALDIVKSADKGFQLCKKNFEALPIEEIPVLRVFKLPENKTWIYEKHLKDTDEFKQKNSSID